MINSKTDFKLPDGLRAMMKTPPYCSASSTKLLSKYLQLGRVLFSMKKAMRYLNVEYYYNRQNKKNADEESNSNHIEYFV